MDKDRYELKGKSFIDNKTNQCLNFGLKDLARVTVTLNNMDMWLEQDKETISDLEAKLAEKECIIAEIKNDIKEMREFKVGDDKYDLTDSDARFSLQCDLLNNEQDKISFAIEKLEKVKTRIQEDFDYDDLMYWLNKQIKMLKEGK